jgi:hypothetical protein
MKRHYFQGIADTSARNLVSGKAGDFARSFKRLTISVASSALGRTTDDPLHHPDGEAYWDHRNAEPFPN